MKLTLFIFTTALGCTAFFYSAANYLGGTRGVILGTSLFSIVHFSLAYLFAYRQFKRKMGDSHIYALGALTMLLGITGIFFSSILGIISLFGGIIVVFFYFLLHFYENIFFFLERNNLLLWTVNNQNIRTPLFFFLSVFTLLVLLGSAKKYGVEGFRSAAITYSGIDLAWYFVLGIILIVTGTYLIFQSQYPLGTLKNITLSVLIISICILVFNSLFNFMEIVYFIILWHFFMWHVYYFWRLWNTKTSGSATSLVAYARSGFLPFAGVTLLLAVPLLIYFALSYDGTRTMFLYHPLYGQFAMFIWSLPHFTFSFLPIRAS